MEVDTSIYHSPKRKRGQASCGPSIITSGLSQTLTTSADQPDELGSHSPSARVAGKFQKLDIKSPIATPSSYLDYSPGDEDVDVDAGVDPRVPPGSANSSDTSPLPEFKPPELAQFKLELPAASQGRETAAAAGVTTFKRARSPPPSAVYSDQFWHASEITGWSPDDPDEDNYGLNGVGYAKSAAKAWAIGQKRRQQIADYRSRETREARQRRHERRLSGFNSRRGSPRGSPGPASRNGDGVGEGKSASKGVRFVHFEDG